MTADQFGRPWQRTLAMKAAPFIILVLAGLVGVTYLKALAHQPPRPATHAWLR